MKPFERIVFPLDLPTEKEALEFTKTLEGLVGVFKVGLELFVASGPSVIEKIKKISPETKIFLDLKFHDIPETMKRAVSSAACLGVDFMTIHVSAGEEALRAAVKAGSASGGGKPSARRGSSYDTLINNISSTYGIETALVKAIIKVESDFDTYAVSEDGAAGLMQLMPDTAEKMGVKDIHDPGQNVRGGVKFLKKLLWTFKSDLRLALAAYNAGENAVLKYGKVPPYPETRNYVEKVLMYRDRYKKVSG